ncbi:glycoside hydrolase family 15 protein [Kocuria palustris]|uniref:glycoside hydrolase family 15 protein n=1 Tax=Kocuria palustris TaxID=71999 RepID=UPI0011A5FA9F|nr:glycoside hydrolase family 15 protein [Kocuria palustris]
MASDSDRPASTPLEDYALLSDLRTAPLVSREGSVDWLCFPSVDSSAVFSALLGEPDDGRWKMSIADGTVVSRRYRPGTFVLETQWESPTGRATVVDLLPTEDDRANLVREVTCTEGTVRVEHDLRIRPDYNRSAPWVHLRELPEGGSGIAAIAGPDMLVLRGPQLSIREDGEAHHDPSAEGEVGRWLGGSFELGEGESRSWVLTWCESWEPVPQPVDIEAAMARTARYWSDWKDAVCSRGRLSEGRVRSLLVLRALTNGLTGGIVAAPTASLPEDFGGVRNWDYRYTWLRDASLTIEAMVDHGYTEGARDWRDWLLRAVAGDPDRVQIMYGIDGRRRLPEHELDHLSGYEGSRPVRIGNGAVDQYQADVVGEVMLALGALRDAGEPEDRWSWGLQKNLLRYCVRRIDDPDHGLWEMRGEAAFFTHGRVMMWAAFNEGLRAVREHGAIRGETGRHDGWPDGDDQDADSELSDGTTAEDRAGTAVLATPGEVRLWTELRDRLHDEIMERGWNEELGSFTQTYAPGHGSQEVDASLLQLTHTGFIDADDPKMLSTVARIERDLVDEHGFVARYRTASGSDGLEGDEYPFLLCLAWLAEQYARSGRVDDAREALDRLESCANDLGLLAEEYSPEHGRLAGNFPQAFSHLGHLRAAQAVERAEGAGPESDRAGSCRAPDAPSADGPAADGAAGDQANSPA